MRVVTCMRGAYKYYMYHCVSMSGEYHMVVTTVLMYKYAFLLKLLATAVNGMADSLYEARLQGIKNHHGSCIHQNINIKSKMMNKTKLILCSCIQWRTLSILPLFYNSFR